MTDEERKQFINEYCMNVGNIKIRCDDCKFVENCVDYGWQGCRKFTPKPHKPMTNEEYLRSLNTEQLAEALLNIMANNEFTLYLLHTEKKSVQEIKGAVVEWLKQPHTNE